MRLKILLPAILLLAAAPAFARDYEGCTVEKINISTKRINPEVVRRRFLMKEDCVFAAKDYQAAQEDLHDMRVFKEIDFKINPAEDNKVTIDIDAKDSYYIFPLPFYTASGGKSAFALAVAEGNFFKHGETAALFAASGDDGSTASGTLALGDNIYQLKYTNMNFTQRFYGGGWASSFGIFNTSEDEGKFGAPREQLYTKRDYFSAMYGRKMGGLTLWLMPAYDYYGYGGRADDGSHNTLTAGLSYRKGRRQGANMGALFGIGLSDKQAALKPLPTPLFGYLASLAYTNGGDWIGADYDINKITFSFDSILELKTRHTLYFSLKAEEAFDSPFSDDIRSENLLTGIGRYSRQIRGGRGAGLGAAFTYYLLRTDLGLLSVQPFYEIALLYAGSETRQHSGAGAGVFYKFWRFPFPFGINYTHNLSDGSDQVGFTFGASF